MNNSHAEQALIDAALAVAAEQGCAAGLLPIPGTTPQLYVCFGEVEQLLRMLQHKRAHSVAAAPSTDFPAI
jgi:hypothetical protein